MLKRRPVAPWNAESLAYNLKYTVVCAPNVPAEVHCAYDENALLLLYADMQTEPREPPDVAVGGVVALPTVSNALPELPPVLAAVRVVPEVRPSKPFSTVVMGPHFSRESELLDLRYRQARDGQISTGDDGGGCQVQVAA